jgi:hypothetical protein
MRKKKGNREMSPFPDTLCFHDDSGCYFGRAPTGTITCLNWKNRQNSGNILKYARVGRGQKI